METRGIHNSDTNGLPDVMFSLARLSRHWQTEAPRSSPRPIDTGSGEILTSATQERKAKRKAAIGGGRLDTEEGGKGDGEAEGQDGGREDRRKDGNATDKKIWREAKRKTVATGGKRNGASSGKGIPEKLRK